MDSQSNDLPRGVTPLPSTDGFYEIELLPSQDEELFGSDDYPLLIVIGGPGSGKTTVNALWIIRYGDISAEQPLALFANTWDQMVNAILPPMYETFAEMGWIEGRDYVMGKQVPKKWRKEWRRKSIRVPINRARGVKMLVLRRSGIHIYLGTYANQSWRRIKGQSIQAIIGEEITEPDVNVPDFLAYAITRVRCGHGASCKERGHFHRIILKGNVPLHNPGHAIYKLVADLKTKEAARPKGSPYFRLLEVDTRENINLNTEYVPSLMAAMDGETFEEQVTGKLQRRTQGLTYYQFSEANILPSLRYDPRRELHLWFDFNKTPATAGWGHDLRYDELPDEEREIRAFMKGPWHDFGVVGELFSDNDPMDTYQVANALIEDPETKPGRQDAYCSSCRDNKCNAQVKEHSEIPGKGWLCMRCAFSVETAYGKMFCSGKTIGYDYSRKHLRAPSGWHGLMRHRGHIFVYADASGRNETSVSVLGSNLKILRDVFGENLGKRVSFRVKAANPPINLRELAMNVALKRGNDVHSLFIAPWCEAHIEDFRQVVPDPKTGVAKKVYATESERAKGNGYWQRTHATDGLGYLVDVRWPFIIPKAGSMPYAGESTGFPTDAHFRAP